MKIDSLSFQIGQQVAAHLGITHQQVGKIVDAALSTPKTTTPQTLEVSELGKVHLAFQIYRPRHLHFRPQVRVGAKIIANFKVGDVSKTITFLGPKNFDRTDETNYGLMVKPTGLTGVEIYCGLEGDPWTLPPRPRKKNG